MKLSWFSPLPPAPTGIAHYTAQILPALTACAEVTLWTDQTAWDPALEKLAPVRQYRFPDIDWREVHQAGLSIYHLGNDHRFHRAIWQVSRQHPGVVVLHDACLQEFFMAEYQRTGQLPEYLAQMGRYHGPERRTAAEQVLAGTLSIEFLAQHFPLSPLALENALGVLVHSPEPLAELRRQNRWPVALAPLPFPARPGPTLAETMHKYWAGPPFRLITFGYLGRNRCLKQVLEALARFPGRHQFRLDVFGELATGAAIQDQLRTLGIEDLVRLHGFVPDDTLEAAQARAHLAINLRFPTMGEASASQLRIWSHSLPTLVTPVGWYARLPEQAVVFVRPGQEVLDLQTHLQAFLDNPAGFAAKGHHGRQLLEERHRPEAYTAALLKLATEARRFRPRSVAFHLVGRAAAEMSEWTGPPGDDANARKVAEEIFRLVA